MAIEWHLNVLMATRRINNKELAKKTGMHPVTISKLKNSLEMPDRLEKNTLEKLCSSLLCQPGDLMRWEPEEEGLKSHKDIDAPVVSDKNSKLDKQTRTSSKNEIKK